MDTEFIRQKICEVAKNYPVKTVTLFGSRANGKEKSDSDIDLIVEFNEQISLVTLSKLKYELEDVLKVNVDIVHGPVRESDLIEIGETVELYAA